MTTPAHAGDAPRPTGPENFITGAFVSQKRKRTELNVLLVATLVAFVAIMAYLGYDQVSQARFYGGLIPMILIFGVLIYVGCGFDIIWVPIFLVVGTVLGTLVSGTVTFALITAVLFTPVLFWIAIQAHRIVRFVTWDALIATAMELRENNNGGELYIVDGIPTPGTVSLTPFPNAPYGPRSVALEEEVEVGSAIVLDGAGDLITGVPPETTQMANYHHNFGMPI